MTACSISHLAWKYGTSSFVRSSVPSADMSTNRLTPASFAAATRSRVPCSITRSKSSRLPVSIATRWTTTSTSSTARRRLSGSVMSPWAASWLGSAERLPGLPLERAHRVARVDEPLDDERADEAGRAGDEDPHVSKFFQ